MKKRARHAASRIAAWLRGHGLREGNAAAVLHDGAEVFPAMAEAIEGARRTVRLDTYIWRSDGTGRRFFELLVAAARRGVESCLLVDGFGGRELAEADRLDLRDKGVHVREYHPLYPWRARWGWRRRLHRKSLSVDGRVGFVGGLNIADPWAAPSEGGEGWRDLAMRVEGPVVLDLEAAFDRIWRHAGGRPPAGSPEAAARGGVAVRLVDTTALRDRFAIHRAYRRAIGHARRSVVLANAYFVPDRRIRRALVAAARRGVEVIILAAGRTDVPLARWAGQATFDALLAAGCRVYEWHRSVLHGKAAVVDGEWLTVGSCNLDHVSFRYSIEANLMTADAELGAALDARLRADAAAARPIALEAWRRRPFGHKLRSWLAYRLRRWL